MTELVCNYAILRFLPYKEIGEFINVGVVVHCPEIDLFDYRLASARTRRVRHFFPELDVRVYTAAMAAIRRQLAEHRNVEELYTSSRHVTDSHIARGLAGFRTLLQRREALLHFAAPGTLLTEPRKAVAELFERYIDRQFANEPAYQENVMRQQLNRWMKEWGVRDKYTADADVGDAMFHLKLPFVRFVNNQAVRAVKPLDLVRPEPTKVFEHGDLWVQRIRRLRERHCLPSEMIFPVSVPTEGDTAKAAQQVLRDLEQIPAVKWLPFDEGDQRLRESLAI